jgi:hypothetical protein
MGNFTFTKTMTDTCQNIIGLQKKKKKLATFTFGEDDEGAQEKLEVSKII